MTHANRATDSVLRELRRLNVDAAEAFVSLTFHRVDGKLVPTMTVFGHLAADDGQKIMRVMLDAARAALKP